MDGGEPKLPDNIKKLFDTKSGLFKFQKLKDGKLSATCNICPNQTISGTVNASSNFLTHYKVRPFNFRLFKLNSDASKNDIFNIL